MKKQGKFIEMSREEFFKWLMDLKVSRKITHIQEHHTYRPNYGDCKKHSNLELVENISKYHKKLGWSCIGQHITTFPDGKIVIGERSFDDDPAGIKGHNAGGICIENLGFFDKGQDVMTEEHKKTIIFVTAALHFKFNLPVNTNTCVYHAWFANKTCPGTNFFGGNTKSDAQKYFYPLVEKQIAEFKGAKTISKPASAPATKKESKKGVKVICSSLWTYNSANWDDKAVIVHKGEVFTIISDKIKVGGGYMYRLKSGLYITANPKYVEVINL
ncbi:hypothetical protein SAMN04489735_100266 [Aneurinibacillus thermoaerophilus]|uniref:N-acetylmuramoyl-L-alanine amidase n=1 Tax=Aneurinibacillus thermoaerophilus TaxID=143495 RepID=A0A1G7WQK1_ANETH|nr:DUF5776 domain-containing protein [Aneurinibacillus thermoaerophilus]SDG74221.1 hypothetical protein SAMN04489735_100266 [Aneurinibacillus thermoaerophilus]